MIIEDSIESKIVELQKKKELMIGAALGDDDQALGRLTPGDLSCVQLRRLCLWTRA